MVSQGCWFLFQHQFPEFQILISFLVKFGLKKSKMSVLTENWYTWYLESVDSKSGLRFLKFQSQNPFMGKFWPKKSKLCVFLKIGTRGILTILILIETLVFWISDPKSIFWANFDQKSQSCPVWLQIGTQIVWAILDKFGLKNSKLFILTEDWHTWYIEDADFYSDNSFMNCQP